MNVQGAIQHAPTERALERTLSAVELADLESLLRERWGRRLMRRIVFGIAGIEAYVYEPAVKDGICSALRMARNEGLREVGLTLAHQCKRHFPELWTQLNAERWADDALEDAKRDEVRKTDRETEDQKGGWDR